MNYRLWVNKEHTLLVRLWPLGGVEVARRAHSSHVWGPPERLFEEFGDPVSTPPPLEPDDPYTVRLDAERIVAEDRVPTDVLRDLVNTYGDAVDSQIP